MTACHIEGVKWGEEEGEEEGEGSREGGRLQRRLRESKLLSFHKKKVVRKVLQATYLTIVQCNDLNGGYLRVLKKSDHDFKP